MADPHYRLSFPVQVTVAPNQQFADVANDGRGNVQKIDLATNKIVKTPAATVSPSGLAGRCSSSRIPARTRSRSSTQARTRSST
jgi:DNA-binding beta-propeller fold protein YncE